MTEPEPSGWELMRAIRDLRESVDKVSAGMISQALFAAFQQTQKETEISQDGRIKKLETEAEDQRKERARQNFMIVMAIVGGAISLGVTLILRVVP